jgi:transposase
MVLWEEYRASHPDGYCQHHAAGDKVFVDYSGNKIGIVDPATGEVRDAEIFVAVLGASNYPYAEATWTQAVPDWIEARVRMLRFFGGVPRIIVPDNLKSGVRKASFPLPALGAR